MAIGDLLFGWDAVDGDELDGVGSCRHVRSNTLCQSDCMIWSSDEVTIFERCTRCGVNNCVAVVEDIISQRCPSWISVPIVLPVVFTDWMGDGW